MGFLTLLTIGHKIYSGYNNALNKLFEELKPTPMQNDKDTIKTRYRVKKVHRSLLLQLLFKTGW